MSNVTFRHFGSVGDIVYSLPTLIALKEQAGKGATLYLEPDHPGNFRAGIDHPCGHFCMTKEYAESLIALLEVQPYLDEVKLYNGEEVDHNLNIFRNCGHPLTSGNIAHYYAIVFGTLSGIGKPWLFVDPDPAFEGMLLVNRTRRYQNPNLSYAFLKRYEHRLIFIGLQDEYISWRKQWHINVPHYQPKTFLEAARAIAACKMFVGNQSSCFAIAESLKVPRIVEVCLFCPNVVPNGENGWQVVRNDMFENIVKYAVKW